MATRQKNSIILRVFFALIVACLVTVVTASGLLLPKGSPKDVAFAFVQVCDPQLGFGGYAHDTNAFVRTVEQINGLKPDFVVICGDLVNEFNEQSIAVFKSIKNALTMPCHCAAGNHDVGNKTTATTLKRYREAMGKDYYSFEHKGYTFVITNTQLWKSPVEGESEKHDAWVRQILKEAKEKHSPVFIAGHHPLFVITPEEADSYENLPLNKRKELLALYEQSGVVAVIAGHKHRTMINKYYGIQLVAGESTSRNLGPLGFRLWTITSPASVKHEFVPLSLR